MTIPPRVRLIAYVVGYILSGVWAAFAPYLAHRGLDSYTIALVAALAAVASGGIHAVAAGHIALPGADVAQGSVIPDDGSDLSVTTLDPSAVAPTGDPAAPAVTPVAASVAPVDPNGVAQ